MISIATFLAWSMLTCSPENPMNAKFDCVQWMLQCQIKLYHETKDADLSFENCSESIPDFLLD